MHYFFLHRISIVSRPGRNFPRLSGPGWRKAHQKPVSRLSLHPFLAYQHHDQWFSQNVWPFCRKIGGTIVVLSGNIFSSFRCSFFAVCGFSNMKPVICEAMTTFELAKVPRLVLNFLDCPGVVWAMQTWSQWAVLQCTTFQPGKVPASWFGPHFPRLPCFCSTLPSRSCEFFKQVKKFYEISKVCVFGSFWRNKTVLKSDRIIFSIHSHLKSPFWVFHHSFWPLTTLM